MATTYTTLQPSEFRIGRDVNSYPSTGEWTCTDFTPMGQNFVLTASTVYTQYVPTGNFSRLLAKFAYSYGLDVWVMKYTGVAIALPSGTTVLNGAVLNPEAKVMYPGEEFQLISSGTPAVSITYFKID